MLFCEQYQFPRIMMTEKMAKQHPAKNVRKRCEARDSILSAGEEPKSIGHLCFLPFYGLSLTYF